MTSLHSIQVDPRPLRVYLEPATIHALQTSDAREFAKGFAKPSILVGHYLSRNPVAQAMFSNFSANERKV